MACSKIVGFPVAPERPSSSISCAKRPERNCPRSMSSSQTLCPSASSSRNGLVIVLSPLLGVHYADERTRITLLHRYWSGSLQQARYSPTVPLLGNGAGSDCILVVVPRLVAMIFLLLCHWEIWFINGSALLSRFECIAQKQVAPAAFDADKRAPERIPWCKEVSLDQPGPLGGGIATGKLWGQRQEQFIQHLLGEEVPQQAGPTFDQDNPARVHSTDGLDNRLCRKDTGVLNGCNLHRWGDALCTNTLFTLPRRDDEHGHLPGLKDGQIQADRAASSHDDIQRRLRFPQVRPQLLVRLGIRRCDVGGRPAVLGNGSQGSGTNDHRIGHGAEQPHHQAVVRAAPADRPAT